MLTRIFKKAKRDKYLLLLMLPGLTLLLIFKYIPYSYNIIAFKDYDISLGVLNSPWVGFKHFVSFIKGPFFLRLMRNTLLINVYDVLFGFPVPIIFALLLNEVRHKSFKKVSHIISYLPHFISTAVVVGMVVNFLSPSTGLINNVLIKVFKMEPTHFLTKPEYFRSIYVSMNIWKSFGWQSIIFTAALAGVDVQLYEAAIVDGAGKWKQLWHITLPGIKNVIIIMLILRMGRMLEVGYESIILMYNPLVYETADVISTFVYRRGISGEGLGGLPDFSFATAVGLYKSLISLVLVITANKLSRKYGETSLF